MYHENLFKIVQQKKITFIFKCFNFLHKNDVTERFMKNLLENI